MLTNVDFLSIGPYLNAVKFKLSVTPLIQENAFNMSFAI